MTWLIALVAAMLSIAALGCSGTEAPEADSSAPAIATASPAPTPASTATPTSAPAPTPPPTANPVSSPETVGTPIPGRPNLSTNPDTGGVWIGTGTMTDTSVQLFWAEVDGAAEYRIYRYLRSDVDQPDTIALEASALVYQGAERGYVDEAVVTGAQYWYVISVTGADGVRQQRWARADAVTDTTPPNPVTGLTVTVTNDEATLTWNEADDNYMFASYAIRRSVDGEQSIYYGTGFTRDATSFIDDLLPPSGQVTYEVYTVDFHDNRAEPAVVTIDLG